MSNGDVIKDEKEITNVFNDYFVSKIKLLKGNIDLNYVEDPLARMKEKMEQKTNKSAPLSFKLSSRKKTMKMLQKMKKKKGSGVDGLSQKQLVMGSDILAGPLTLL